MLLGILSDTHGHAKPALAGVHLLVGRGCRQLLHCGDVGSRAVLDAMLVDNIPAGVVWGNTDFNWPELGRYASSLGITHDHPLLRLTLAGKRIGVTHGDNGKVVRQIIDERETDYLFVGHSHVPADETINGVRIINPGALHRAAMKTVATLDLTTGELHHLEVLAR